MSPSIPSSLLGRREFFSRGGFNLGAMALNSLIARDMLGARPMPHYAPKAQSVIFLNMAGAPPHLDMFEYKPKLKEYHNQEVPESLTKGERFAFISGKAKLLGPLYDFQQFGHSGMWMSSVVSDWMSDIADDITMIHGIHTDQFNHSPAALLMFTGFPREGRPSMGAWVNYGLGSEAENLPGFVVLSSGRGARCGTGCFGSGFLPSVHQGVLLRSEGDPVLYLKDPDGVDSQMRRRSLDSIRKLNEQEFVRAGDPEIQTRIAQYELAYRMQQAVPELADLSNEPEHIHKLYGTQPGKRHFSNNCLLARRLVEAGVRYIQLNHGEWDLHGGGRVNIPRDCPRLSAETFPGAVALVKDLKQRGLLDKTLVVWGGEFGRTPMLQGSLGPQAGRDHHKTFTMWMAGGGVKPGFVHGGSDELGYRHLEGSMHVHDIQATILHLLGIDHERLTYKFQGRHYRLTDVHGHVNHEIIA